VRSFDVRAEAVEGSAAFADRLGGSSRSGPNARGRGALTPPPTRPCGGTGADDARRPVIGGGLVGLATAYRLADGGASVAMLGRGRVATGQTAGSASRARPYYRPGSLRARLCTQGKRALEEYAERRGVPMRRTGKVVVAVEDSELSRLDDLFERGLANGIEGLELLSAEALRDLEPNVTGVRALRVPGTGVIDFRRVEDGSRRTCGTSVERRPRRGNPWRSAATAASSSR
jgi:glycine/D-amino acid oxidase-like deaminating enzyme